MEISIIFSALDQFWVLLPEKWMVNITFNIKIEFKEYIKGHKEFSEVSLKNKIYYRRVKLDLLIGRLKSSSLCEFITYAIKNRSNVDIALQ